MAVTPIYSIPYQALTDQPDGAGLGQNGFLAVESQLARIDGLITAANANYVNSPHGIVGGNRWTGGGTLAATISSESATNMATPSLVLKANRLFKIKTKFKVTYSSGSVTSIIARVRDTNLAGAALSEFVEDAANSSSGHTWEFDTDYETTVQVTKQFIMTLTSNGASSNVNAGGTTNPTWMEVFDMGPSGVVTVQTTP